MTYEQTIRTRMRRRALMKSAAWSVPVAAVAVMAPAVAVSPQTTVSGISLDGECGTAEQPGPSFVLTAGVDTIPVATRIAITSDQPLSESSFVFSGDGAASLSLEDGGAVVTLIEPLESAGRLVITWLTTIDAPFETSAALALPMPYRPGPGSDIEGRLYRETTLCASD